MVENQLTRYGAVGKSVPFVSGKVFFLLNASEAMIARLLYTFPEDTDGVTRVFSTYAAAITAVQAEPDNGKGTVLYVSPNFTTAPTGAQLISLNSSGVSVYQLGTKQEDGTYFATRTTAALPQSTTGFLFQVNGKVELIDIIGENTASSGATASAVKYQFSPDLNPTPAGFTDISATSDFTAQPIGATITITGTLANVTVITSTQGVYVRQAAPIVLSKGRIAINASGSQATGSVKFRLRYRPIEPGAFVSAL